MNGAFLRFYVHEGQRHHGVLMWEWLLKKASALGIRGGSAFRAVAGFGRHHVLHEQTFFELCPPRCRHCAARPHQLVTVLERNEQMLAMTAA